MNVIYRSTNVFMSSAGARAVILFGFMVLVVGARFPIEIPGYVAPTILAQVRVGEVKRVNESRRRLKVNYDVEFYVEEIRAIVASLAPCPQSGTVCPSTTLLPIERVDLQRRLASVRRKLDDHVAFVARIQGPVPESWSLARFVIWVFRIIAPAGLIAGLLLLFLEVATGLLRGPIREQSGKKESSE